MSMNEPTGEKNTMAFLSRVFSSGGAMANNVMSSH